MILVDISAWIEYDRATGSAADKRISSQIKRNGPLAVTEPVVMEVIAGARNDQAEKSLRGLLARFELLRFDAIADFDAAASIYRRCRSEGATPRGMIDCMIAAVAWRHQATVLAHDVDFDRMAGVVGIELDRASLRA